jgi:uncharacterized membrane protein
MLVTLPIGMWVFSLVADFIARGSANAEVWQSAALYTMVGGIIGALAAAVPGLIDLLSLRDAEIKGTAIKHMSLNLTIVVLYAINAWTRVNASIPPNASMWLSIIAIALLLVSGWLGGKMVYEAGVAVHAADTAPSAGSWEAGQRTRAASSSASMGGMGLRGDRAMAADSERPGREPGESRKE